MIIEKKKKKNSYICHHPIEVLTFCKSKSYAFYFVSIYKHQNHVWYTGMKNVNKYFLNEFDDSNSYVKCIIHKVE